MSWNFHWISKCSTFSVWNSFQYLGNSCCLFIILCFCVCLFVFQHPVYCVNVVGTQNAHNLISVSTDGKMCSWSLDMLSQPQVKFNSLTRACSSHENPFVITCPLSSHPLPFPSLPFSLSPPHPAFSRGHKSKYDALPGYLRFSLSVKRRCIIHPWCFTSHSGLFLQLCMFSCFMFTPCLSVIGQYGASVKTVQGSSSDVHVLHGWRC